MRILAEGTCTIGAGSAAIIPAGTGAGQLPATTRVIGLYVVPNSLSATARIGLAAPKHQLQTSSLGFLIQHTGPASDWNAIGTQNDTFDWTAYGSDVA